MTNRLSRPTLAVFVTVFCLAAVSAGAAQLTNTTIFPTGLTYDGTHLYLSYGAEFRDLKKLDAATGAVIASIPFGGEPRDVVYDGAGRFLAADMNGFVREVESSGLFIQNMPLPFRGGAIAFDGVNIYAGNTDNQMVQVLDRAGNPVRQFDSGLRPEGMVFDPSTGRLWVITLNASTLFEITTDGALRRACETPFLPGPFGLGGITLVGPDDIYIAGPVGGDPYAGTVIHILNRHELVCQTFGVDEPPTITGLSADLTSLWPPNHRMVDVQLSYAVSDDSGADPDITITVSSNEGTGADWVVVDDTHIKLRAARFGSGSGRVYTITVTATDASGNTTSQSIEVGVPHDQGH